MGSGLDRDKIKNSLLVSGYSELEIDEVFQYIDEALFEYKEAKKPNKKHAIILKAFVFIALIAILVFVYFYILK